MSSQEQTYRPELLTRQGERNAWLFALFAGLGLGLLQQQGVALGISWIFVFFIFVAALSISLGNWMDRRTVLRLAADGVSFENGLRNVQLGWTEVKEVRIHPARWGEKIQVLGEKSHFSFNTLGELQFHGKNRTRVGFARGQEILKQILDASGLTKKLENDQYAYYSRP